MKKKGFYMQAKADLELFALSFTLGLGSSCFFFLSSPVPPPQFGFFLAVALLTGSILFFGRALT